MTEGDRWSSIALSGLVLEQGGMLSHGVIVAREYGLPAVINVPHATRIIKTGQRITMDGNRGLVFIAEEPSDP